MTTAAPSPTRTPALPKVAWWVAPTIVLVALNLRAPVVAVGPLLETIRADVGLTATAAGVLTALPVLCFGVLAPIAPRAARRIGIERTLLVALIVLALGCAVRLIPTLWALFGGTVLIGAAIAAGNVLVPALIKRDFAHRTGLVMAAYSAAISLGGALGAGVTVPLADALGLGWRAALGSWLAWTAVAVLAWLPQLRRVGRPATPGPRVTGLSRQPLAWQVTTYMGVQSLGFYAVAAWLPAVFVERGYTAAAAGGLLALLSVTGFVGGVLTPMLIGGRRRLSGLGIGITALTAAGLMAVWLAPGLEMPAVVLLGFAQGASLSLALMLMVLRAPDTAHAAQLSGMAQSYGYALAAAGPFAFGLLHDLTGGWAVPLGALVLLLVPQGVAGYLAGRDRQLARTP